MRSNRLVGKILLIWLSLIVTACNMNLQTKTPTPLSPEEIETQIAQTIIAQLTEIAGGDTPTPGKVQPPATVGATEAVSSTAQATSYPSTETPTPSPSPLPSPTLAAGDPRSELGTPDFQDNFENADNWAIYSNEHVEMTIENNHLEMKALNADKWDSWMLAWPVLKNFYVEAVISPGKCKGLDHYGLVFRAPDDKSGYFFTVSCDGQYSLRAWNGARFSYLIDWTKSDAILSGEGTVNRLAVRAEGGVITVIANGQVLGEAHNSTYSEGGVGLFVGATDTPGFTVQVTEFSYWELP